jgi:zeaxanthin glucosyltransferase
MKTVVFLMYHGMGHFHACFKMARMLGKEHDVVFAGVEYFENYMKGQGFIYYPLKSLPFGMGFEKWLNEQKKSKHLYFDILKDRWRNQVYQDREAELLQLMYDVEPDYLFIDSNQSTDFIILYKYLKTQKTKVAFIQTMLPTTVQKNYPPLNSLALPNEKAEIKKAIDKFKWTRLKKLFIQKLQFLGMDDLAIIKRNIWKNRIPKKYLSKQTAIVGFPLSNIDEFVTAPVEFDFPNGKNTKQHYIGFMLEPSRIEISDLEYFKIDEEIRKKIKQTQAKLIYCSFGSVKLTDTSSINSFLEKLNSAVQQKNWIVIVSIHATHHLQKNQNHSGNLYFLKAAPQLEILQRADVFITHGGLNSIKESIYAGVPMLMYPLHDSTDHMGNSSRVVYHKLGLRGNIAHDSEAEIISKIDTLLNSYEYKKNIYKLRAKDEQYTENFLQHFRAMSAVD